MKDLYKLRKSEYKEGAEKTLLNSEKHYEASLILAQNGLYPFAISHIILAAEELTKATILRLKSIDNSVSVPDLDKYFKSHDIKHSQFFKISKQVKEYLKEDKDESKNKSSELLLLGILGLIIAITYLLYNKKNGENKTLDELENEKKDIIDSIEKVRIASTYVELLHSRIWRAPFEEYNKELYNGANELYSELAPSIKNFVFTRQMSVFEVQNFIERISKIDD